MTSTLYCALTGHLIPFGEIAPIGLVRGNYHFRILAFIAYWSGTQPPGSWLWTREPNLRPMKSACARS